MKEKILKALKDKYSNLGLGDARLDQIAGQLSSLGLVNDDNLTSVIDSQEPFLKSEQSDLDKKRREHADLEKRLKEAEEKVKKNKQEGGEGGQEDEPEWFKKYKKEVQGSLESLQKENKIFKEEKAAEARKAAVLSKAKELGIPDWRIEEGLGVSDDMDDLAISNHLTKIKKNIVTAGLDEESGVDAISSSGELMKQRAEKWAKQLPDNK